MAVNDSPGRVMPYDEPDLSKAINRTLHWLARMHFAYCDSQFETLGIGPGQVPILLELGRHEQLSQRDLAEKVRVTPATISGTLKRLEKSGLVVRKAMEDDMRVSLVSLSDSGKKLLQEAQAVFRKADDIPLRGFSDQERSTLLEYFRRMLRNMQDENQETFNAKEPENEETV